MDGYRCQRFSIWYRPCWQRVRKNHVYIVFEQPNWQEKRKIDGIYADLCANICINQNKCLSLHRSVLVVPEVLQTIRCFFCLLFCANLTEMLCQFYKNRFFALPITDYFLSLQRNCETRLRLGNWSKLHCARLARAFFDKRSGRAERRQKTFKYYNYGRRQNKEARRAPGRAARWSIRGDAFWYAERSKRDLK